MKRLLALLLALSGAFSGFAEEKNAEGTVQLIPVHEHGVLKVTVPKNWHFHNNTGTNLSSPPTIDIHPEEGNLAVQLTIFWDGFGTRKETMGEADMSNIVQKVTTVQYAPGSVEKKVVLEPLKGPQVSGTFARFTDARWTEKTPPHGEYRNVSSGMFRSGNLWGNFTLLTPDKEGPGFKQAMNIMESLTTR